jgi:hypothetical protein
MQTQSEIFAVLDAAEKAGIYHPLFSRDEFNATLIRTFIENQANGFWSVQNINSAIHANRNAIHWLQDPNATPAPVVQPEPRQPSAADLAAEKKAKRDAAVQARRDKEVSDQQEAVRKGRESRRVPDGFFKHEEKPAQPAYRRASGQYKTQTKGDSAVTATGHIESNFVAKGDQLNLDTTTKADLAKATPAQIKDFTKRLRERDAKK